jgi:hypothetical protein
LQNKFALDIMPENSTVHDFLGGYQAGLTDS